MKMRLSFTEISNVENHRAISKDAVKTKIFDWEDEVSVKNMATGDMKTVKIKKISLFDNYLMLEGKAFVMTGALSKRFF